jgi:hypothetical protein
MRSLLAAGALRPAAGGAREAAQVSASATGGKSKPLLRPKDIHAFVNV